jgi:hypothetical protein
MNLQQIVSKAIAQIEVPPKKQEIIPSVDPLTTIENIFRSLKDRLLAVIHQMLGDERFYLIGYLGLRYEEFVNDKDVLKTFPADPPKSTPQ